MSALREITTAILAQMPPANRFSPEDAQVILSHKALLASLEEKLVQGFYDTLFDHAPTRAIFVDGERPAREETLRRWWQRTIAGPFDDHYWEWQTLVGLIHVKRGVENPMMISMWGWTLTTLQNELEAALPPADLACLLKSFLRLAATAQALTAESYLKHYIKALAGATGFELGLLDRLVHNEVDDLLRAAGGLRQ
jgi:hypothetical protein